MHFCPLSQHVRGFTFLRLHLWTFVELQLLWLAARDSSELHWRRSRHRHPRFFSNFAERHCRWKLVQASWTSAMWTALPCQALNDGWFGQFSSVPRVKVQHCSNPWYTSPCFHAPSNDLKLTDGSSISRSFGILSYWSYWTNGCGNRIFDTKINLILVSIHRTSAGPWLLESSSWSVHGNDVSWENAKLKMLDLVFWRPRKLLKKQQKNDEISIQQKIIWY